MKEEQVRAAVQSSIKKNLSPEKIQEALEKSREAVRQDLRRAIAWKKRVKEATNIVAPKVDPNWPRLSDRKKDEIVSLVLKALREKRREQKQSK